MYWVDTDFAASLMMHAGIMPTYVLFLERSRDLFLVRLDLIRLHWNDFRVGGFGRGRVISTKLIPFFVDFPGPHHDFVFMFEMFAEAAVTDICEMKGMLFDNQDVKSDTIRDGHCLTLFRLRARCLLFLLFQQISAVRALRRWAVG